MAWMRMMGADSVAYHRETVLGRADDHPGEALAYFASRGETPLMWGGAGARALGLVGNVTEIQYETLFGPGGAVDPTTGERLVGTRRPGMELIIAAHKSMAELGVIGPRRGHAPHPRRRAPRHHGLPRQPRLRAWWPPWFGICGHAHRRADVRRHPPRHLPGRRSVTPRPRAHRQPAAHG